MVKSPFLYAAALMVLLPACQSTTQRAGKAVDQATTQTRSGLVTAVSAPLRDLNLQRGEIPAPLKAIKTPYTIPQDLSCPALATEIEALNGLLGRDWDVPPPDKKALEERAADGASTALLDAVADQATGLIPYRGLVRSVSGAKRHERKVQKAYARGAHRRTFLKGLGYMQGCDGAAAPLPPSEDAPRIVFR